MMRSRLAVAELPAIPGPASALFQFCAVKRSRFRNVDGVDVGSAGSAS